MLLVAQFHPAALTPQSQTLLADQVAAGREAELMLVQVVPETLATLLELLFLMVLAVAEVHGTHPVALVEQLVAAPVEDLELPVLRELQILDPEAEVVAMVVLMAALVDLA
jgi:hypothetical protein